jgi:hypothetical protein
LDESIAFSDTVYICPTEKALMIAEMKTRTVVGYQGLQTKFIYNTKFME